MACATLQGGDADAFAMYFFTKSAGAGIAFAYSGGFPAHFCAPLSLCRSPVTMWHDGVLFVGSVTCALLLCAGSSSLVVQLVILAVLLLAGMASYVVRTIVGFNLVYSLLPLPFSVSVCVSLRFSRCSSLNLSCLLVSALVSLSVPPSP